MTSNNEMPDEIWVDAANEILQSVGFDFDARGHDTGCTKYIRADLVQGGWQAIDTAPKDGTEILILEENSGLIHHVVWQQEKGPKAIAESWRMVSDELTFFNPAFFRYWMPLSNVPAIQA